MKKKEAKIEKRRYLRLSELDTRFNLRFSSHITVGDKLIGLDGIKKQLLVADVDGEPEGAYVIDLNEVDSISLKKSYGNIMAGELRRKRFEEFLNYIHLRFRYKDHNKVVVLPFYEREKDPMSKPSKVEVFSKKWQTILSKIIGSRDLSIPIAEAYR